ncbi:MAG: phosphatase PAP2 family protein [Methanobacteriaceae archaeon]|nr:phosphatase PAP2 family protein [Methanobacteriaceae archaeon]
MIYNILINIINLIYKYNISIFYTINNNIQNNILNIIMPIITNLGNILLLLSISIILYLILDRKFKKIALLCIFSLIITGITVYLLKNIVAEPRPFLILPHVHLLLPETEIYSFPSGHTASIFAIITTLIFKYKTLNKKYNIFYPLIIIGILVGFSRIYIGVHYPLDVIAGALIGILMSLITIKYEKNILNNTHKINLKYHNNTKKLVNIRRKT